MSRLKTYDPCSLKLLVNGVRQTGLNYDNKMTIIRNNGKQEIKVVFQAGSSTLAGTLESYDSGLPVSVCLLYIGDDDDSLTKNMQIYLGTPFIASVEVEGEFWHEYPLLTITYKEI